MNYRDMFEVTAMFEVTEQHIEQGKLYLKHRRLYHGRCPIALCLKENLKQRAVRVNMYNTFIYNSESRYMDTYTNSKFIHDWILQYYENSTVSDPIMITLNKDDLTLS